MSISFDPNAAATEESGIFGLPYTRDQASLIYYPVPWEATTSYGGGTSRGPRAILEASKQVDLYEHEIIKPYEAGLHMMEESPEILAWNEEAKALAQKIIAVGGQIQGKPELEKALARVNELSTRVNDTVFQATDSIYAQGKIPAIVGGDHAVPLGAFKAAAKHHPGFGILHFDAHSDTRIAYEGFKYSHASIMYNALQEVPECQKLVQVGIRDYCEQEMQFCDAQGPRVHTFFDLDLFKMKAAAMTWGQICNRIVAYLPHEVWISFDIDGLDPKLCPHTGTPVPGGLEYSEAAYLIGEVSRSGRKIIGFDLNEVSPHPEWPEGGDEWDANVGARLLYKLTAWTLASQNKCKVQP